MARSVPVPHPSDWPIVELRDIVLKIGSGATPTGGGATYLPKRSRFALLRSQNVFDRRFDEGGLAFISDEQAQRLRAAAVQERDLLLNITGDGITFGRACIVPQYVLPACVNQHVAVIRVDTKLAEPGYVLSFLTHPAVKDYIESFNAGGSRRAITKGHIQSFRLALPPLPEQRAIAHILGTLDDKIELNRRMSETLEAMARALFKSWFVDFDPVHAKVEGRDSGLPRPLADLLSAGLVGSELGEIPEGWQVASVYAIADVIYGAPFASAQFNAEGVGERLIRIRDLADESPRIWTPEVHPKGYKVRPGDIVVGMDGEFRAYLWGGAEAWLNQRICVFAPKPGWGAAFVRNSIIEPLAHVEATETATTVIHLGKADIDRFKVLVPGQAILAAFNRACQPWYDRIVAGKKESRTLAALRDTLLPKLISGELRVRDAARLLEALP